MAARANSPGEPRCTDAGALASQDGSRSRRAVNSFFKRNSGATASEPQAATAYMPDSDAKPSEPTAPVLSATNLVAPDGIVVDAEIFESGTEPSAEAGVHAITRNTDYWFERRAHALEQRAGESAAEWARAGLPLQDVEYTEPLDVEVVLASHARQTYRDWAERVRTKMGDAISRGSRAFGEHVGELRQRMARLDAIAQELSVREGKIERIRDESARDVAPVQYHRFVSGWIFWPMAFLLVCVEFAANFPVFRLLLPLDSALANAAQEAAENIRTDSWLAGLELFGRGLVMNIEAFTVAAVVVVALVVLAKTFGGSLRPLVALSAREHPLAATTIRGHRRQQYAMALMCFVGMAAVIYFLFSARGSISQTADSRVVADSTKLAALAVKQAAAQATGNLNEISDLKIDQLRLEDLLERHKDDAGYARTIEKNNKAILFLNLGLILAAAVLGFGYARENLSDRRGEHPDLEVLRTRCAELRQEQVTMLSEARAALTKAGASEGAVRHLAHANPLATWESKAKRLQSVVPHFRAENARLRGLDPANVSAFALPSPIVLEPIVTPPGFPVPEELEIFAKERDELAHRLGEHRTNTATPTSSRQNGRLRGAEVTT